MEGSKASFQGLKKMLDFQSVECEPVEIRYTINDINNKFSRDAYEQTDFEKLPSQSNGLAFDICGEIFLRNLPQLNHKRIKAVLNLSNLCNTNGHLPRVTWKLVARGCFGDNEICRQNTTLNWTQSKAKTCSPVYRSEAVTANVVDYDTDAESLILTWYVAHDETTTINKELLQNIWDDFEKILDPKIWKDTQLSESFDQSNNNGTQLKSALQLLNNAIKFTSTETCSIEHTIQSNQATLTNKMKIEDTTPFKQLFKYSLAFMTQLEEKADVDDTGDECGYNLRVWLIVKSDIANDDDQPIWPVCFDWSAELQTGQKAERSTTISCPPKCFEYASHPASEGILLKVIPNQNITVKFTVKLSWKLFEHSVNEVKGWVNIIETEVDEREVPMVLRCANKSAHCSSLIKGDDYGSDSDALGATGCSNSSIVYNIENLHINKVENIPISQAQNVAIGNSTINATQSSPMHAQRREESELKKHQQTLTNFDCPTDGWNDKCSTYYQIKVDETFSPDLAKQIGQKAAEEIEEVLKQHGISTKVTLDRVFKGSIIIVLKIEVPIGTSDEEKEKITQILHKKYIAVDNPDDVLQITIEEKVFKATEIKMVGKASTESAIDYARGGHHDIQTVLVQVMRGRAHAGHHGLQLAARDAIRKVTPPHHLAQLGLPHQLTQLPPPLVRYLQEKQEHD